jgi:hypothetical protein
LQNHVQLRSFFRECGLAPESERSGFGGTARSVLSTGRSSIDTGRTVGSEGVQQFISTKQKGQGWGKKGVISKSKYLPSSHYNTTGTPYNTILGGFHANKRRDVNGQTTRRGTARASLQQAHTLSLT